MIDYANCNIERIAVHQVGNKNNEEPLHLSESLLDVQDERLRELLLRFFLQSFEEPEFFSFTFANEDLSMNPVYRFVSQVFDEPDALHPTSADLARHLYEQSVHPQIKSGNLFVVHFTDIVLEDELTDAIGIFKSEIKQPFLKLDQHAKDFSLFYEDGINVEKLDKGCLIFNTDLESGFQVCIVDKSNKSIEARYWRDDFLNIKPRSDDYHHTKQFMSMTKHFVVKQLAEEFPVSKADQIDLLNRSVDYFQSRETFDKQEFEEQVFQEPRVIDAFRNFNDSYRNNNDVTIEDQFDISAQAVKKQSRIFKSVLKLDKNFHVYIHGDRSLIEQGTEADGRKFYKIYYEHER